MMVTCYLCGEPPRPGERFHTCERCENFAHRECDEVLDEFDICGECAPVSPVTDIMGDASAYTDTELSMCNICGDLVRNDGEIYDCEYCHLFGHVACALKAIRNRIYQCPYCGWDQ